MSLFTAVACVIHDFWLCQRTTNELGPNSSMAAEATAQQQLDRDMIARIGRGDETAFDALYDRLSGPLYSLALKMLDDAADAQDALQDAFLQIWSRAGTYDPDQSSVFSWSVLLTRSRVIDRLRARSRRLRVVVPATDVEEDHPEASDASVAESAADTTGRKDEAARVRSILNSLPAEQREAIELAFFTDLTHHEIAAHLGQPLGTIKARIRRGLLKVRERFHTRS